MTKWRRTAAHVSSPPAVYARGRVFGNRQSLTRLSCAALAACLAAWAGCETGVGSAPTAPGGGTVRVQAYKIEKRLVLVPNHNSAFWDVVRIGLREGERDFRLADCGLAADFRVFSGTPAQQAALLRELAGEPDVAGVAVSILDAEHDATVQALQMLQEKGIAVITVDADVDRERFRDRRAYYIGMDNLVGGRVLGTVARAILESRNVTEGNYIFFVGHAKSKSAEWRMQGFRDAIGASYRESPPKEDEGDVATACGLVRKAIASDPGLVALIGIWSYNASAIGDVLDEVGGQRKYAVVGFDAEPTAIRRMQEGWIDALVVQNPFDMGYQSVRLLKALVRQDHDTIGKIFPPGRKEKEPREYDIYRTGLKLVVSAEMGHLKAEMFSRDKVGQDVEFMTLDAFKAWLGKYRLPGS